IRKNKKSTLRFFGKTILFINILFGGALLISYLTPYLDPAKYWFVSFFGLGYPFLLLINCLFILYWLFRKPKFALISLLVVLSGTSFILRYIGFRESTAIEVPKSSKNFLRVMTYNVHFFKPYNQKNDIATRDQILNIIRKEQPDVICFQEYFTRQKGEYNFNKLLKEILQTQYSFFKSDGINNYEAYGMATFSKFPILKSADVPFENATEGNEAIYSDIKYKDTIVRVYNVHLQSFNFQPEDYEYMKEIQEIDPDVKSSRRIGSRLKSAIIKRSSQAKVLKQHSLACKKPYIIAGDFNDTPISYAVSTVANGLNNAFKDKGSGLGVTYNGDFPNFQIDYILTSKDFSVKNYQIVKKKLSDHYAVRSDLELNK
ncbi:MAG: endonuclease, partial [Daejeonella sp.]|nr:endonuclease [Daejeonella sp.]